MSLVYGNTSLNFSGKDITASFKDTTGHKKVLTLSGLNDSGQFIMQIIFDSLKTADNYLLTVDSARGTLAANMFCAKKGTPYVGVLSADNYGTFQCTSFNENAGIISGSFYAILSDTSNTYPGNMWGDFKDVTLSRN